MSFFRTTKRSRKRKEGKKSVKRIKGLNDPITGFEGKPITDGEGTQWTPKLGLLSYCRLSNGMDLGKSELATVYSLGMKIGRAEDYVDLTQSEYDILKKMTDDGQISRTLPNGQKEKVDVLPFEVRFGLKEVVDSAEKVEKE